MNTYIKLDKTNHKPQLHLSSLWWTKFFASNKNGQFAFTHINVNIFLLLSTTLQPDCQQDRGFEIDFLLSDAKGVIEKIGSLSMQYQKSTIITYCFCGGCCCCPRKSWCEKNVIHVFSKQVILGRPSAGLKTDEVKQAHACVLFYPVLHMFELL